MATRLACRLHQISHWDTLLCLQINRANRVMWLGRAFGVVSRLGNGVFWYVLMLALLAWNGVAAAPAVLHMIVVGLVCTVIYKWLKSRTLRPRPFHLHREIFCSVAPLDQFSFPSGHTLHAVAFSIVALAYYPALFWLVVPFTVLVALSRLVLGLHYPSDVLAGALLGAMLAGASLTL